MALYGQTDLHTPSDFILSVHAYFVEAQIPFRWHCFGYRKGSLLLSSFCSASSQLSFSSDALFSPLVASQTFSDTNVTVLHGWPKQCYQYTENTLFFNSSARVMESNPIAAASEILEKWQHLRGSGIVNCNHILSANNSCQSDWKCLRLWNKMVAWRAKYKLHKEMAYKLVATSLSCTKSLSNCNFVL